MDFHSIGSGISALLVIWIIITYLECGEFFDEKSVDSIFTEVFSVPVSLNMPYREKSWLESHDTVSRTI